MMPFIDLSFAPSFQLISRVRGFVREFYGETLNDDDLVSRLEVATHEMLENAVKGSSDDLARIRIELLDAQPSKLVIRTWNRASASDLEEVSKRIRALNSADDPLAHYQTLMESSAGRSDGSGLGLGRVRAEAEMEVSHSVDGDTLCITAEMTVEKPSGR